MAKKTKQTIEAEIKEYKDLIAAAGVPQDEKDFAKGEIEVLEKELEAFEKKPSGAAAAAPARDRSKFVKERKNAKLDKVEIEVDGKRVKITEADCWDIMSKLGDRIVKAKESAGKYKTKPVTHKVGDTLEHTASHAADAVTEKQLENHPADVIKGAEMMEKGYEQIFAGFEKMTGKKIPEAARKQIKEILNGIVEDAKDEQKKD